MQKILAATAMLATLAAGTAAADTTEASTAVPTAAEAAAQESPAADTPAADAPAEGAAVAEEPPQPPRLPTKTGLHLALTAGLSSGGDTLAEVTYTNGDSEKIKAGGMFYFAAGPSLEFANSPWSVQALLGRHFDSVSADNAELSFERNTLELQVFNRIGAHRLGLGYVKHLSPEYEQSGSFVTPGTAQFADANGLSFEYNWMPVGSKVGLSARAVKIDYDLESVNGVPVVPESFSGNHFAIGVYLYF